MAYFIEIAKVAENDIREVFLWGASINSFWNFKAGIFFNYEASKTEFSGAK